MKKLLSIIFFCSPLFCFGQAIINQGFIKKSSKSFGELIITDYYYTIANTVNKQPLYKSLSKQNRLVSINDIALKLKSDSFTVVKNNQLIYSGILGLYPSKSFILTNESTKKVISMPLNLEGEITANRAIELILNNYDKNNSRVTDEYLYFNKNKYKIISNDNIQERLVSYLNLDLNK